MLIIKDKNMHVLIGLLGEIEGLGSVLTPDASLC